MEQLTLVVLVLAGLIVAGLLMTRLTRLIHLPNVTAYLLAGLLVGPSMMLLVCKLFNLNSNFITEYKQIIKSLSIIGDIALGFIALSIGVEFKISHLRKVGKRIFVITLFEALTAVLFVDIVLLLLRGPLGISTGMAITLGAIAAATAPAATLLVIRQYNAKGPIVSTLLPIVAMDDAIGLIAFSISFSIAKVHENGTALTATAVIINPLIEIFASLLLGLILGIIMTKLTKMFKSRANTLGIMLGFTLISVAIAHIPFEFGAVNFELSALLMCMMLGATYTNMRKDCERYLARVDEFTPPLFLSFFVISGASIDLAVLGSAGPLLAALIYFVARSFGKYIGARTGSLITKSEPSVQKYLGITLLPQAGVAVGMAGLAYKNFGANGHTIYTIILCSTLIYEIIGPILTKWSLEKSHEINKDHNVIISSHSIKKPEPILESKKK